MDDVDRALVLDERVTSPREWILPRLAREICDAAAAVVRVTPRTPDARATSMHATDSFTLPQFFWPDALWCDSCTRAFDRRPISMFSSTASRSLAPSLRMWLA